MTDQHGQHWPDKGHLDKWPSDATPERAPEPNTRLALPGSLLWLFLLSGTLGLLWFGASYLHYRQERMEKANAYERANAMERRVKERQRREYETTPRPDLDKAIRDFRVTTEEKK